MARGKTDEIAEIGSKFVNSILNMETTPTGNEKEFEEFAKKVLELQPQGSQDTIIYYMSIINLFRLTDSLYSENIDYFERKVLQLNSVISTSLTNEYRIHDLLDDKREKDNELDYFKRLKAKFSKLNFEDIEKLEAKKQQKEMHEAYELFKDMLQYMEYAQQKEEIEKKALKEYKNSEYFIVTLSKDENLINLFQTIFIKYLQNEIIKNLREYFINKLRIEIKPKKETVETTKDSCLNRGAYKITVGKVAEIITLSLENQDIIDERALKIFSVFMDIEKATKTTTYRRNLIKRVREIEKNFKKKDCSLNYVFQSITNNSVWLLEEMRWCDIEKG